MTNDIDRKIDNLIDEWLEAGTRNPQLSRVRHMSDAECVAAVEGEARAQRFLKEQEHACHCYPKGFISTPREVKERMKAEHLAAGVHELWCPLGRQVNPLYSRAGDTIPPSYTRLQQRRDEDAERVEYGSTSRFRQDE